MTKLPVLSEIGPVDYGKPGAPPGYHCGKCGARGVKLWRDYQTFLDHQSLLCAACACAEQGKTEVVPREGGRFPGMVSCRPGPDSDAIGWRVPAVPTEDGATFWGYSSVPDDGCRWWYGLPLTETT